jgi:hypothetical protein
VTAFFNRVLDVGGDRLRLLANPRRVDDTDRSPFTAGRAKLLFKTRLVIEDQPLGGAKDRPTASIVVLQADGGRLRKNLAKPPEVGDGRAAEFVDALIVVTDDAEVSVRLAQEFEEPALRVVGVLELVDHDLLEAAALALLHGRLGHHQPGAVEDGVVEVEPVLRHHPRLVGGVDGRRLHLRFHRRVVHADRGLRPLGEFFR